MDITVGLTAAACATALAEVATRAMVSNHGPVCTAPDSDTAAVIGSLFRPYRVVLDAPWFRPGFHHAGRLAGPVAGGCATHRSVSLTPYGWHRIVTVETCIRP